MNRSLDDDSILKSLLATAEKHSWHLFAEYCEARLNNLRKPALEKLAEFCSLAKDWPLERRISLCQALCGMVERYPRQRQLIIPQSDALKEIIRTTLGAWIESDPEATEPLSYSGRLFKNSPDLARYITLSKAGDQVIFELIDNVQEEAGQASHKQGQNFARAMDFGDVFANLDLARKASAQIQDESDRLSFQRSIDATISHLHNQIAQGANLPDRDLMKILQDLDIEAEVVSRHDPLSIRCIAKLGNAGRHALAWVDQQSSRQDIGHAVQNCWARVILCRVGLETGKFPKRSFVLVEDPAEAALAIQKYLEAKS